MPIRPPAFGLRPLALVVALLAPACAEEEATAGARRTAPADAPSILLVTLDTLRADRLGAWGGPAPTPHLDALARRGTRFAQAFSASSSTAPSHASILTGLYPSWHTVGLRNGHHRLDDGARTLAETLWQAGWDTGAVVSNAVLSSDLGLDQGFDHYDDAFESSETNRDQAERTADRAVERALAWLERPREGPFFLWLHLQDAHGPYLPPDGRRPGEPGVDEPGRLLPVGEDHSGDGAIPAYQVVGDEREVGQYAGRYLGEIAFLDEQLGRLLAWLEQEGRAGRTLVLVTADHGEALGEDGFWFAHGHSVGRDQTWVPLLLAGPGVAAGRTVEVPVSNVALFATALSAAGLPLPDAVVGPSLLEVAAEPALAPPVYLESLNQMGLVHEGALLRRDRRPPGDEAFWSAPNPNSGGSWRPLDEEWLPLQLAPQPPSPGILRSRLLRLADEADAMRALLDGQRQEIILDTSRKAALESLGYLR